MIDKQSQAHGDGVTADSASVVPLPEGTGCPSAMQLSGMAAHSSGALTEVGLSGGVALRLGSLAKTAIVFAGLMYTLGLLIDGSYLSGSGIRGPSLLRADYVLKGGLFVVIVGMPGATAFCVARRLRWYLRQRLAVWRAAGRRTIGILGVSIGTIAWLSAGLVISAMPLVFLRDVGRLRDPSFPFLDLLGRIALLQVLAIGSGVSLCLYALVLPPSTEGQGTRRRKFDHGFLGLVLLGMVAVVLSHYSTDIYPGIDPSLGGGRPVVANVVLSSEGVRAMEALGVSPDAKGVLRQVLVVHETEDCYFIQRGRYPAVHVLHLPKRLVEGVLKSP